MGNSESRARFHGALARLQEEEVASTDAGFWEELWMIPESAEEVFQVVSSATIKRLRLAQPRNLETLVTQAEAQLAHFTAHPHSGFHAQALNCVRLLTRIVPFLLQDPGAKPFVDRVFWGEADGSAGETRVDEGTEGVEAKPDAEDCAQTAEGTTDAEDGAQTAEGTTDAEDGAQTAEGTTDAEDGAQTAEAKPDSATGGEEPGETEGVGGAAVEPATVGSGAARGGATAVAAEAGRAPLAERIVHHVHRLLFLPGFTLTAAQSAAARDLGLLLPRAQQRAPPTPAEQAFRDGSGDPEVAMLARSAANMPKPDLVWCPGVAFPRAAGGADAVVVARRTEVLKLLLVCLSSPLYSPPDAAGGVDRWVAAAVSPACPLAGSLFVSLLNTALGYDPVGWGVPYASALAADDPAEDHALLCLHVLVALLGFRGEPTAASQTSGGAAPPPPLPLTVGTRPAAAGADGAGTAGDAAEGDAAEGDAEATAAAAAAAAAARARSFDALAAATEEGVFNFHRYLLQKLVAPRDLRWLFGRFAALLLNAVDSQQTYLPGSAKRFRGDQEVLVLLWKLADENKAFLAHALRAEDVTRLSLPVLFLMHEGRADASRVGLVHMCTFLLLLLSGERNFGVALNKPLERRLPGDLSSVQGSHADLLLVVLHKLFVSGARRFATLHTCFLTVITNVSPYIKHLSLVAAVKLVNLCEAFSTPRFLYGAEDHPQYMVFLLEALQNVVQYQYEGNAHLVYAIVRRRDVFERLADLPAPDAGRSRAISATAAAAAAAAADPAAAAPSASESVGGRGARGDAEAEAPASASAVASGTDPMADAARAEGDSGGAEPEASNGARPEAETRQEATAEAGQEVEAGQGESAGAGASSEDAQAVAFTPTPEWVRMWQSRLPIYTILRLLQFLGPQVEALCERRGGGADEEVVLSFLRSGTMVGLLPVPHPIVVRRYNPNRYTNVWFTTFSWGIVYLHHDLLPLFDAEAIRLFQITMPDDPDA